MTTLTQVREPDTSPRIYVTLYGGANYSRGDNIAYPVTLAAARERWLERRSIGYHFRTTADNGVDAFFHPGWGDPAVNELHDDGRTWTGGHAWYAEPGDEALTTGNYDLVCLDTTDRYPDRELIIGPRGGATWRKVW